ncbi:hypothetical protein NE237_000050 [Protea cynaroides]|uniref:Uncharacterized protein n=1 Tax=Protea cynaroides TaxID=273540 RepID=A0A9Q0JS54_9MAGN|nr:hypothetical protein NE237_000050 [Protea cynaroides]
MIMSGNPLKTATTSRKCWKTTRSTRRILGRQPLPPIGEVFSEVRKGRKAEGVLCWEKRVSRLLLKVQLWLLKIPIQANFNSSHKQEDRP